MTNLLAHVATFEQLRVLVVGDAILDCYVRGTSDRLAREAPVPVVTVESTECAPGGAANLAANVRALGAQVDFLSVVGTDSDAEVLRATLDDAGVHSEHVVMDVSRRTVAKRRIVSGDQILVRFDEGSASPLSSEVEEEVLSRLDVLFPAADVVAVSDYGYGVLTDQVIQRLSELQRRHPRVLVVDPKSVARYSGMGATAIKPNYEAVQPLLGSLASGHPSRADAVLAAAERLPDATGAHIVAVTLDQDGAVVCERNRPPYRTYSRPVASVRACGAGDSFTAGLALALGADADTPTAAEIASAAAAVVLARDGTSTCSAHDLREHLADVGARLEDAERLAQRLAFHKRQGRCVVFTNGCFDILHRGHVDLLNRAKALGDVLVVGLNSDDSIRRLKGSDRPVNRLEDRAQVLAALSCVDHLVAFDGETASDLLEVLRPDVYVKGGDYTQEMLPEAPVIARLGGAVRILPYLEDRSTSGIIARIRGEHTREAAAPTSSGLPVPSEPS